MWLCYNSPSSPRMSFYTCGVLSHIDIVPAYFPANKDGITPDVGRTEKESRLAFLGGKAGEQDYIQVSRFTLSTKASMTATAVMLTTSRTEHSKSVKWMGLLRPICIGPITSVSGSSAFKIL